MPASNYTGNAYLNLFLRGVPVSPPTRVWISLHTADPGLNGANAEINTADWPAYARQDPAQGAAIGAGFTAAASKATENTGEMLFPANDGAQTLTVTHFAIWDALIGGNCLFTGALSAAKTIFPTDELVVKATELDLSVN
jgi:hypothetical protein